MAVRCRLFTKTFTQPDEFSVARGFPPAHFLKEWVQVVERRGGASRALDIFHHEAQCLGHCEHTGLKIL